MTVPDPNITETLARPLVECDCSEQPTIVPLRRIIELTRMLVLPEFMAPPAPCGGEVSVTGLRVAELLHLVAERARGRGHNDPRATAAAYVAALPGVRTLLMGDIDAVMRQDPAVTDRREVVLCYPATTAMLGYRAAHVLHGLDLPLTARFVTEHAHARTGIDIHPAAQIGPEFAIDHGTGVVIGQTCVIGRGVTIYQGVTLGARSFARDHEGVVLNIPRHPIIGDGVTIYSNATILGRVTIGEGSVIGGNVWLTHDVPPCTQVTVDAVSLKFDTLPQPQAVPIK